MKTRTDLLNHLAEKYNLERYLEIGVQVPALNFDKIICPYKVGVDPDPQARADFQMTSDAFFDVLWRYSGLNYHDVKNELVEELRKHFTSNEKVIEGIISFGVKFDLIFIDGLHTAEQVKKDFENALKILSPNGFIVLHDCNPEKEEHTIVPRPTPTGHWNGDVYKFAMNLKCQKYCVDIDNGCMVVPHQERIKLSEYLIPFTSNEIWRHFDAHRKELLNLISWDEFVSLNP